MIFGKDVLNWDLCATISFLNLKLRGMADMLKKFLYIIFVLGCIVTLGTSKSEARTKIFLEDLLGSYNSQYDSYFVGNFDALLINKNSIDKGILRASNTNQLVVAHLGGIRNAALWNPEWNVINQNEDWFWHDLYGNRVYDSLWNYYWMDWGNPEYLELKHSEWNKFKIRYPEVDMIFCDENGSYSGFNVYQRPRMTPNPIYPYPDQPTFDALTCTALTYIRTLTPQIGTIINSDLYAPYSRCSDGAFTEDFVHTTSMLDSSFKPEWQWRADLNKLSSNLNFGKKVFVRPGTKGNLGDEASKRVFRFAYASFMLGQNMNADNYFCFVSRAKKWPIIYPAYSVNYGIPLAPMYKDSSGIWIRKYTIGDFIVNPTSTSKTITLDPNFNYRDWDSRLFLNSRVTLTPNTGTFLTKIAKY